MIRTGNGAWFKIFVVVAAQSQFSCFFIISYAMQSWAASACVRRVDGRENYRMTDRVLSPDSLTVAAARSAGRGTRGLCLIALVGAALLCPPLPAMAGFTQGAVPKFAASDAMGSTEQGFSVAVSGDGNTAIVGGPFDNSGVGAVWVFTRSGGTWTEQQKLTGADLNGAAQLGWSVALSVDGTTAIVGGPGDNGSTGAAWVFTQSGGVWTQQGAKLTGTNATGVGCAQPGVVGSAEQGYSVAVSGDGNTAIVGGWADSSARGAAWVFTRSAGVWGQSVVKLCGSGATGTTDILQGFSVSLSDDGSTAIIGGPNDNGGVGAAWVFTQSGGTWTAQGGKLVDPSGVTSEQGFSVALSANGDTAIVGGPGEETTGTNSVTMSNGAAWLFTRSGGAWSQQGGMLVGTSATSSNPGQGFSVTLGGGGNTALVGGPSDNANTGAAWVFVRSGGIWTQQGNKLVGTNAFGAAGQASSVALSRNGSTAIIGGALDQAQTGAAWVFHGVFAAHDFNGDGISDVLWGDAAGDVAIWLMNGSQVLSGAGIAVVPNVWSVVGTRDFTGTADADLLWLDTSGDAGIWLMNGTSVSSYPSLGNIGTQWSAVGTGDFTGTRTGDILWRNTTTGDLGIWVMSDGQFSSGIDLGIVALVWQVAGTGDFNGDGTTDILWRNTSTGDLAIWFMTNGQILSGVDLGAVPLIWTVVGTGDFDGDGTTDVLWRDSGGNLAIWLISNGQFSSGTTLGQIPLTWSVAETGDFDGDGMSDILWTDQSGDLGIWFMNGLTVSTYSGLGNVGTSWQVLGRNAD
jgi:hypothetical protein